MCHSRLHQPPRALPYGLLQGVSLPQAQLHNPAADRTLQGLLIRQTSDGARATSFQSLMSHLAQLGKYEVTPKIGEVQEPLTVLGSLSENQARAFELLGVKVK